LRPVFGVKKPKMIRLSKRHFPVFRILLTFAMMVILTARAQTSTKLYNFSSTTGFQATNNEGIGPFGGLVAGSNALYGVTQFGGTSGYGTVFAMNSDGTGFTNLHSFDGATEGGNPNGSLVLVGATLFGTTQGGGTNGNGTIFKVDTNGAGFAVLYIFSSTQNDEATNSDGAEPVFGLTTLATKPGILYGVAGFGGSAGVGTLFQSTTNGGPGGFAVLHTFSPGQGPAYTNADGFYPNAIIPVANGPTLFGTSTFGGTSGFGEVFRCNVNSGSVTNLYSFTNGPDGAYPIGAALGSAVLYGTTIGEDQAEGGGIFSLHTDGTGLTNLRVFTNSDGSHLAAGLILAGSTIYGAALAGGASGNGLVFTINTNGSGYTNLYTFTSLSGNVPTNGYGAVPAMPFILSGGTLFGEAFAGGPMGGGTVFALNTNGAGFTNLHNFNAPLPAARNNDGSYGGAIENISLVVAQHTLYGAASAGGTAGSGSVYRVNDDGTGFTNLHNFSGLTPYNPPLFYNADGNVPNGQLVLSSNVLYGTTRNGGSMGLGTVFKVNTDGTGFMILHNFEGPTGRNPFAGLILSSNTLYGAASLGGAGSSGVLFKVNTDGTGFDVLHSFSPQQTVFSTNSDGAQPQSQLVISGNVLYGTTGLGGSFTDGTLFRVNTDGSGFANLHDFDGDIEGDDEYACLVVSGQTIYGLTAGGSTRYGNLFTLNTDGTGFTVLHTFAPNETVDPSDALTLSGNVLYGTAFSINTDGTGCRNLCSPPPSYFTLTLSGNSLYGIGAGVSGDAIIRLLIQPELFISQSSPNVVLSWITNSIGFTLQKNTNLHSPAAWTSLTNTPVISNGWYLVTNSAANAQMYYRLNGTNY
jgi:uncharacterized repeat protein (TIGR03803 family)